MRLVVISTGLRTPEESYVRCVRSVKEQTLRAEHVRVDPAWEGIRGREEPAHFETLSDTISQLESTDVVVSLDLDDCFSTPDALAIIARAHELGAWVTWGSFRYSDGRPGFAAPLAGPVRSSPWVTTHCKSYRAGLFQRIRREDLMLDGAWLKHARDMAVMFPAIEMAGVARSVFLPNVIYTYHLATSGEWTGGERFRRAEKQCVDYVRSRKPYEEIERL